jgi:hypothetical protein
MIFTWDLWTANVGQWQCVARYLNDFGSATWFFPDGSKLEQAGNGLEIYTYPDGTSTSNVSDTQVAALAIVERAQDAAIDTILADGVRVLLQRVLAVQTGDDVGPCGPASSLMNRTRQLCLVRADRPREICPFVAAVVPTTPAQRSGIIKSSNRDVGFRTGRDEKGTERDDGFRIRDLRPWGSPRCVGGGPGADALRRIPSQRSRSLMTGNRHLQCPRSRIHRGRGRLRRGGAATRLPPTPMPNSAARSRTPGWRSTAETAPRTRPSDLPTAY